MLLGAFRAGWVALLGRGGEGGALPGSSLPLCVAQANPEEFIPIFANNSRELKAFLEHMSEVQPNAPQGVYDTLLELRLQNWAHEQDPQVGPSLLPPPPATQRNRCRDSGVLVGLFPGRLPLKAICGPDPWSKPPPLPLVGWPDWAAQRLLPHRLGSPPEGDLPVGLGPLQVKEKLHNEALSLLKSGRFQSVFDKALVLCQMHNFKDGILYLYEQGKLCVQGVTPPLLLVLCDISGVGLGFSKGAPSALACPECGLGNGWVT